MTKYINDEIFSSGRATLYKNPSDQTVIDVIYFQLLLETTDCAKKAYFFSSLHLSKFIFHVFGKAWFMTWLVACCLLGLACSSIHTTHIMRNAKFSAFFSLLWFRILKTRKRKRMYASKDNEITRCLNQLLCGSSQRWKELNQQFGHSKNLKF